jgi:predicted secreted protein
MVVFSTIKLWPPVASSVQEIKQIEKSILLRFRRKQEYTASLQKASFQIYSDFNIPSIFVFSE